MGVITISREYGSDGQAIGLEVSKILNYTFMDKDLLLEVAHEAQVPLCVLKGLDENPENPVLRVLRKFLTPDYAGTFAGLSGYEWWTTSTIPASFVQSNLGITQLNEEKFVDTVQQVIFRLGEQGNMVFLGRGSPMVLKDFPNILKVRLIASLENRCKKISEQESIALELALKKIKKIDQQRKLYIKRYYQSNWDDSSLYHLIINTGKTGSKTAIQTIVEAARNFFVT